MVIFHCYVSSPEGKSPTRSIVSVSKKNGWDSPPWKNSQKIWSPRKGMQDSLTGFLAPTGLAIPGVPGVLWKCWKLVYHCFAVNFCAFHNSKYFRLGQLWRFSRNITTYKYIQIHTNTYKYIQIHTNTYNYIYAFGVRRPLFKLECLQKCGA